MDHSKEQKQSANAIEQNKLWNQIMSALSPSVRIMNNEAACHELPQITPAARRNFINDNWGPNALAKVESHLQRLSSLEENQSTQ